MGNDKIRWGQSVLLDNKSQGKVGETLVEALKPNARLSVLSALFSIYGFSALRDALEDTASARLLLADTPDDSVAGQATRLPGLAGSAADRRFRNGLDVAKVARECADWLNARADVRAIRTPAPLNLFHLQNPDGSAMAIHGSSSLTSAGLGVTASVGYEMNTAYNTAEETSSLLSWFDGIWNDPTAVHDIKADVLAQLEEMFSAKSPALIYYLTLFSIFRDFIGQLEEDKIIKTGTGIKGTVVWSKLYRFQRDGVLGAIDKIERYNGCIIADSVGLGKTFEALAIIKYYELRNDRVLVLAPKKLRENWTIYTVNDRRNIFAQDRFNYDVLNHTDLSRARGMSGEINLATLNWGNYDLIVIDESHNFRNSPRGKDANTRYSRLMTDIIRSGVQTKVLMLSATPVNNRMNDLKNQVAFITEGKDDGLIDSGIVSIEQTLRKAQAKFNAWLRLDNEDRTVDRLLEDLNFDYFKLLDLLTIARSRKHIEKYYDLAEIGDFPERLKPRNIKADIDTDGAYPPLFEVNRDIRRLNLAAYSPLKYVLPEKRDEYSAKYDVKAKGEGNSIFRGVDREQSLIHLMRVNLLKRMESSINSFGLTVEKLLAGVQNLIERIDGHDDGALEELGIGDLDIDDEEFEPLLVGNKVKVLLKDVDRVRWRQDLKEDERRLLELAEDARQVDASRDEKLRELKALVKQKIENPINDGNRKIVIFTAFADTAGYLYANIAEWAQRDLKVHSALVTGSGTNKTTLLDLRRDLNSILTAFSPISKERSKIDEHATEQIDILIATDCISEGQNLQDCDFLVNYDIHWNPVRIIQRFGRVDRLGSKNKCIQLVNFWPNMELDEYIDLEARVSGRMVLLDISATGEENIIDSSASDQMRDLEYRKRQLEQLQHEVVNMEDLSNGISITDLTLNDFRMDLADYLKEHAGQLETMPPGVFAVVNADELADEDLKAGVVFCLKSENSKVSNDTTYALAPYYLVYVGDDGEIRMNFTNAKRILDVLKKVAIGRRHPDMSAGTKFDKLTRSGKDMSHYRDLLAKAVNAITGKAEEKGVESLFQRGGTVLSNDSFRGVDDFEVIAYLVLVEDVSA